MLYAQTDMATAAGPGQLSQLDKKPSPSVEVMGQLQPLVYQFSQSAGNLAAYGRLPEQANFRRARIGAEGLLDGLGYRLYVEFITKNEPEFRDLFIRFPEAPFLGHVRLGQFFEPFGLERITPNIFTTFIERAMISQAFAPGRNIGVAAQDTLWDQRLYWSLGLFYNNLDEQRPLGNALQSAVTGRVTGLPIWEDDGKEYVHLGIAASARFPNRQLVSFRAQPEAILPTSIPPIPNFVDTGKLATDHYHLLGVEFVSTHGPVSVQAEYNLAFVPLRAAGQQLLQGGYAQVSWLMTGEHRPYNRQEAVLHRVIPARNFHFAEGGCSGGIGAWELGARISWVDLDSGPIAGGRMLSLTTVLNWYLNPHCRMIANYVHAAPFSRGRAEIFGIRFGYDF